MVEQIIVETTLTMTFIIFSLPVATSTMTVIKTQSGFLPRPLSGQRQEEVNTLP